MKIVLVLILTQIFLGSSNGSMLTLPLILLKTTLSTLLNGPPGVDKECVTDLKLMARDLITMKHWAIKMVDATGKVGSGLLDGNIHIFGDYDLCLDIKENLKGRTIEGQYCTAFVTTKPDFLGVDVVDPAVIQLVEMMPFIKFDQMQLDPKNITIPLGICVPKSCSAEGLKHMTDFVAHKLKFPWEVKFAESFCLSRNKPLTITGLDIFIYCFFSVLLMLILASTIYEAVCRSGGETPGIFSILSLYSNTEKFFKLEPPSNLSCLCGIKVICSGWIIFAHIVLAYLALSKNSVTTYKEWWDRAATTIVASTFLILDSFLTVAGFLVTYLYLKASDRMRINLISFYCFRMARLWPVMLATVFIHTSILKLLTDGPYGRPAEQLYDQACPDYWWKAFSLFYNWLPMSKMCAPHIWYLSLDSQLYFAAPIILFFFKKYPKNVLMGISVVFSLCVFHTYLVTVVHKLGFSYNEMNKGYWIYLFNSIIFRLPCWLIGVVMGYIVYQNKIVLSKTANTLLLLISLMTIYKIIIKQLDFVLTDYDVQRSALWNSLGRPAWSLATAFLIFSCATGQGGIINTVLSHSWVRILSRLTYCLYLVHVPVMVVLFGNLKETLYFSLFQLLSRFCGIYIIAVCCAFVLYMGFEAPILAIKDHMQGQETKTEVKKVS